MLLGGRGLVSGFQLGIVHIAVAPPTVDAEGLAGHVGNLVCGEGENGLGHLSGVGDPANGESSFDHCPSVSDEAVLAHFGIGESG